MSRLFLNNYRGRHKRKAGHDYASPGIYFVTIMTKARIPFFGKIISHRIVLNNVGRIVRTNWINIQKEFSHIYLDTFVIMPNHMHGLIIIKDMYFSDLSNNINNPQNKSAAINNTGSGGGVTGKYNPMLSRKSVSYIIRRFKAKTTTQIKEAHPRLQFAWQARFYDQIITDKHYLYAIRQYIKNNPKNI